MSRCGCEGGPLCEQCLLTFQGWGTTTKTSDDGSLAVTTSTNPALIEVDYARAERPLNRYERRQMRAQERRMAEKKSKKERSEARKQAAIDKANACSRCQQQFKKVHILDDVCEPCLDLNPKLTSEEKSRMNLWDSIDLLKRIVYLAEHGEDYKDPERWTWSMNHECKYLDIRVDMRDGGCLVSAKGERIGIDALNWQWSEETPERPKT